MKQSVRFLTIFVTTFAILTAGHFSLADDKPVAGSENAKKSTDVSSEASVVETRLKRFRSIGRNGGIIKKGERPITDLPRRPIIQPNPPVRDNPRFPPGNNNGGTDKPPARGSDNTFSDSVIKIEITDSVKDELASAVAAMYLEIRMAEAQKRGKSVMSVTGQRTPLVGKLSREAREFKKRIINLIDTKVLQQNSPLYNRDLDYEAHLENLAVDFGEKYIELLSARDESKSVEIIAITLEAYATAILKHIRDTQPNRFLKIVSSKKFITSAIIAGLILTLDGIGFDTIGTLSLLSGGFGFGTRKYLQTRTKPLAVKTNLLSRSTDAVRRVAGRAIKFIRKDNISNLMVLVDSFWLNAADNIELALDPENQEELKNAFGSIDTNQVRQAAKSFINTIDAGQGIRNEMVQFKSLLSHIEDVTEKSCKDLLVAQQ